MQGSRKVNETGTAPGAKSRAGPRLECRLKLAAALRESDGFLELMAIRHRSPRTVLHAPLACECVCRFINLAQVTSTHPVLRRRCDPAQRFRADAEAEAAETAAFACGPTPW